VSAKAKFKDIRQKPYVGSGKDVEVQYIARKNYTLQKNSALKLRHNKETISSENKLTSGVYRHNNAIHAEISRLSTSAPKSL